MDLGLEGKVALVGGGSQGLGRGTAEILAREGMAVAIYALDDEHLPRAAAELEETTGSAVLPIPLDVRDADGCRVAIERVAVELGGIDAVVINMAGSYGTPFPDDDDGWTQAWEMWALSSIRITRLIVPHLRRRGGGSIINITSC